MDFSSFLTLFETAPEWLQVAMSIATNTISIAITIFTVVMLVLVKTDLGKKIIADLQDKGIIEADKLSFEGIIDWVFDAETTHKSEVKAGNLKKIEVETKIQDTYKEQGIDITIEDINTKYGDYIDNIVKKVFPS